MEDEPFGLGDKERQLLGSVATCHKSGGPFVHVERLLHPYEPKNCLIERGYVVEDLPRETRSFRIVRLTLTAKGEVVARLLGLIEGRSSRPSNGGRRAA